MEGLQHLIKLCVRAGGKGSSGPSVTKWTVKLFQELNHWLGIVKPDFQVFDYYFLL